MKLIGNIRLGKDAELRYLSSGSAVANLAGVYDYGRKGDDGRKPSQWVDLALFGKQAEALSPYLVKGSVLNVTTEDVHIETYTSAKGQGSKLVGKIISIDFAPSQPARDSQPRQEQKPKAQVPVDDLDSDIPF